MVCFSSYFQIYISKLFNDQTYMHIMFNPSFRTSLPQKKKKKLWGGCAYWVLTLLNVKECSFFR